MNKKYLAPIALAVLAAASATGITVFAAERGDNEKDAAMLATATVTLQQAVATAEQQAGGRAVSADLAQEKGAVQYEVEVAGAQGVKTVLVDAKTGQVSATRATGEADEDND